MKKRIQKRFEKSTVTYNENALAQTRIAGALSALISAHVTSPPGKILEIGCGTGLLTHSLHHKFPESSLYLNDLNENLSPFLKDIPHKFLSGDAEKKPLPGEMNLIVSSSTFQWFHDLPRFFQKLHCCLDEQGKLIFTLFGKSTLAEIRLLEGTGLDYFTLAELSHTLEKSGFRVMEASEEIISLTFPEPKAVLKHLKLTGVNAGFTRLWTREKLENFTADYKRFFSTPHGVRLTYHPLYIVAERKKS